MNNQYNKILSINKDELKELKKLYEKCPPGKTFMFKEAELLKEYAKYLIEYLENNSNEKNLL